MIVELFRVISSLLSDLSGSYGLKIWQDKKMLSERRQSHTQGGVNDVGFTPQGGDNDVSLTPQGGDNDVSFTPQGGDNEVGFIPQSMCQCRWMMNDM